MTADPSDSVVETSAVDAGGFSGWMKHTLEALADGTDTYVPCASCDACCRSSFFIHVAPDEFDTLSLIPAELRFPAPGSADGTVILGFDAHGRCPMLHDDGCSIYPDRPRACRMFDCRVFTAAGLDPRKPRIAEMTDRWRFNYSDSTARDRHHAVEAACAFLLANPGCFPGGEVPANPSQTALLALRTHALFLGGGLSGTHLSDERLCETILLAARQGFDGGRGKVQRGG